MRQAAALHMLTVPRHLPEDGESVTLLRPTAHAVQWVQKQGTMARWLFTMSW